MPKNDFSPLPPAQSDDKVISIKEMREKYMDGASSIKGEDLIKAKQAHLSDFTHEESAHMEIVSKNGLITMNIIDEKEKKKREEAFDKLHERTPEQQNAIMESL